MRIQLPLVVILGALLTVPAQDCAKAGLLITIDKAQQRMIVAKDDLPLYDWPVSTGQRGYDTPVGVYRPFRMEAEHYSREWDDAPMPHSIFFTKIGHAIHGSFDVKKLGHPASHGCVRLKPEYAAILYRLVRAEKMANTRVVLTGTIPGGPGKVKNVLGVDPYAADEGLVAWARPAPPVAEVKHKAPAVRHPVRTRARPPAQARRPAPRYYYRYEERRAPRDERRPSSFADIFFGARE
jgi:hypothetical protein